MDFPKNERENEVETRAAHALVKEFEAVDTGTDKRPALIATIGTDKRPALIVAIVAVVAVIAAIIGFALYGSSLSSLPPATAAAKVNDSYIDESRVSEWIDQYRSASGYTDDATFASALASQGMSVSDFRISVINQLALADLVNVRAKELGITVSDEEAQAKVDSTKAAVSGGDDQVWQQTLEAYGLTEAQLLEQWKTNLAQDAICEKDVPVPTATDSQMLSYAQSILAGTTQGHVYRIVLTGSDASTKADAVASKLTELRSSGKLSVDTFTALAKQYSNEDGVQNSGGDAGWTCDSALTDDELEVIEKMSVGAASDAAAISDNSNATEFFYVSESYTFPESSQISSLSGIPEGLTASIKSATQEQLWTSACTAYLAKLLADAKITYYPIPETATYNVDISAAS